MLTQLLHSSQWAYKHRLPKLGKLFERIMMVICSAHISGRAEIHPTVKFSHGGIGVIINPAAKIGENCHIGPNVTIGNRYPHGTAPIIGKNVYIGSGAYVGGVKIADNVIVGANSTVVKDIDEECVTVAGNPARVIRRMTLDERMSYK